MAGPDAAEFEQLGGVEGAAAEDDFFAGTDYAGGAAAGGVGVVGVPAEGACFVEVGAFEVGNASCFWLGAGFVEEDAGYKGVCFEREGMACGDGVEDSLSNLFDTASSAARASSAERGSPLTLLLAPFFMINGI